MAVKVCMFWIFLAAVACLIAESSSTSSDMLVGGEVARSLTQRCNREGGDCIGENNELIVDSKINRRSLFQPKRHISYDAIKKDWIPCSKRGRSYYDCTKASQANPYNRGCTVATHCARIIR
ncbi:protein RALF-like 4 [Papaver somniferum]|uniref:protein RALF-like 4 n=1 Tax=Papaver somniferum TaxID=3469 RepID=UPI000E6FCFB8|nr:protein RALF-like 4 [Papaver somniferum]